MCYSGQMSEPYTEQENREFVNGVVTACLTEIVGACEEIKKERGAEVASGVYSSLLVSMMSTLLYNTALQEGAEKGESGVATSFVESKHALEDLVARGVERAMEHVAPGSQPTYVCEISLVPGAPGSS